MKQAASMIMVAALLVGGCSGMSTTQQRTLSGGAIGAGAAPDRLGAGVRLRRRHRRGAGLLGGYAYDQYEKSQGRP